MKACVFTLGCKVNEVESASLMRGLEERGYETTDVLSYADIYFINTCAVTAEAERKSRQAVARVRKFNPSAPVIVFGCASQKEPQSFSAKSGVTFVSGAQRKDLVLDGLFQKGVIRETESVFTELPYPERNKTRAFLRIQDGCNRFCSYCIIPYLRGRSRSRSAESVVAEARASGAKEIVLTGIDVSSYRDGERGLAELVQMLKDVPARFRFGSLERCAVTEELLLAMKEAGNFAPHFHMCLQSGSSKVLKDMNRHYTREEYLETCALIKEAFPEAAITTDIIVGFPTETEADFSESLSAVEEAGLARVHAFPYSPREGTNSYKLKDLPLAVKKERMERMLAAANRAENAYIEKFLGREEIALFEREGGYTGNYIRVYAEGAREGAMCRVKLSEREQDGVRAEILEELK